MASGSLWGSASVSRDPFGVPGCCWEALLAIAHDPYGSVGSAGASWRETGEETRRADRFARTLRRARRHSRLVRTLRVALPVLAALTFAGFVIAVWVRALVPDAIALDSLKVEGGELVMTNPRLRGFDERDQPYRVDATRATQSVANPERFRLEEVSAELPLRDGRRVTIETVGATFDRAADRLDIPGAFTVKVDDGTVAVLNGGTVDVEAGTFASQGAVNIARPDARILADRLDVDQSNREATFSGRVRVTIEPGSRNAPPTLREGAPTPLRGTVATPAAASPVPSPPPSGATDTETLR